MAERETSFQQTLAQARAAFAFDRVREVRDSGNTDLGKRYRSQVEKLPAMIQTNGLGQALAFLFSKGTDKEGHLDPKEAEGRLYKHLDRWLGRTEWPIGPYSQAEEGEGDEEAKLLYRLSHRDSRVYRRATVEALALITWLRRFASGMLEREGEE